MAASRNRAAYMRAIDWERDNKVWQKICKIFTLNCRKKAKRKEEKHHLSVVWCWRYDFLSTHSYRIKKNVEKTSCFYFVYTQIKGELYRKSLLKCLQHCGVDWVEFSIGFKRFRLNLKLMGFFSRLSLPFATIAKEASDEREFVLAKIISFKWMCLLMVIT